MFDTVQVGRKIKALRLKQNMTQMNLADTMGVSYQAVSNWERGSSMPDIGKLGELAGALGCSIDELLGVSPETEAVKAAVEMEQTGQPPEQTPDLDTVAAIAPILKPDQTAAFARRVAREQKDDGNAQGSAAHKHIDLERLIKLAPFLDDEVLDELVDAALTDCDRVDSKTMLALAPFLSDVSLEKLAQRLGSENLSQLVGLAPFLEEATLDRLVLQALGQGQPDFKAVLALAPFLGSAALDAIAMAMVKGGHAAECVALYPFLSDSGLRAILKDILASGDFAAIQKLSHFL